MSEMLACVNKFFKALLTAEVSAVDSLLAEGFDPFSIRF